jgi:hypothetical protein
LDNWSPGLKEVNTFNLHVSAYTEMSFKLLDQTIRETFEAKGPPAGKNVHPGFTENKLPSL